MIFWDCGSSGLSRYSFMIILECSIQSFQASLETFSKMRWPSSPFHGTRSRPSIFLPNFTHITVRVPGWPGADPAGFAGPQLSSAIFASGRHNQCRIPVSKHTALRGQFLGAAGTGSRQMSDFELLRGASCILFILRKEVISLQVKVSCPEDIHGLYATAHFARLLGGGLAGRVREWRRARCAARNIGRAT